MNFVPKFWELRQFYSNKTLQKIAYQREQKWKQCECTESWTRIREHMCLHIVVTLCLYLETTDKRNQSLESPTWPPNIQVCSKVCVAERRSELLYNNFNYYWITIICPHDESYFSISYECRKHRKKIFYKQFNHYLMNNNWVLKGANTPPFPIRSNFWPTPVDGAFSWILLLFWYSSTTFL